MRRAEIRFDGGARPTNPGHAGFASVVTDYDTGENHVIARYIGWQTNNVAEYYGLIVALKYACFLGFEGVDVISDSKLVVNQIKGSWQIKQPHLRPLVKDAGFYLSQFKKYTLEWEGRDSNDVADAYCTSAINWGRNQNPILPQSIKDRRPGAQQDPFGSTSRAAGRVRPIALSTLLSSLNGKQG